LSFLKKISNPASSDKELVILYKQTGDSQILAELYQRYMDMVFAVCMKYLQDREPAKDAVMNIFEELLVKMKKHEVEHFKAWLYTVAKTHCLMQLRAAKKVRIQSLDGDLMQSAEEPHLNGVFEKETHLNQMTQCLEKLSPDQKMTVELFYLKEKSYKEIAGMTGLEWDKVRSLIQNGRRNLRICMEDKSV
jgi:RNA polymerase sigma-70 factor (ECF subfamily)